MPALRRWAPEYRREAWRRALADRFDAVIVGGDVGVGKPDRAIFERAPALLSP